jgi:hypothetical protein
VVDTVAELFKGHVVLHLRLYGRKVA